MLTAATTANPSTHPTEPEDTQRLRVAPREIHDVAYRALRVAGASAGEAQLAARAVARAEVDRADGLALLLGELPMISRRHVAGRLRPGPVRVLDDPARRGLFYTVPAAVEAALAAGPARPILIPGAEWQPAVDSLVAVSAQWAPFSVRVLQLDSCQRPLAGDPRTLDDLTALPSDLPEGLLVNASPIGEGRHDDVLAAAKRWADAVRAGVFVEGRSWNAAESAAREFLVPER
jgi:hypothetical protein